MRPIHALILVMAAAPVGAGCGGCGDDDGASADGGAFTLVNRTPAPDDDNVWVYDPIVLEFSHPLDPESVSDQSIALEAAGSPVAHETALSEDGTTVTLTVSEPPATPVEVNIAVGSDVLDDQGTAFAGESWSFTLPTWQHPEAAGAIADGQRPQLALGPGGTAIVGRIDPDGVVSVQELDGQSWVELAAIAGQSGSLRLAGSGDAVAAAFLGDGGVAVAHLAGGEWELLGTIPLTGVDAVPFFDLAVASDGNPMVAVSTGGAVQVSHWNGSSF
ncbi:MAG TPA: Ig-like domain-containing protein, partial [Kofleriaceae bacterium]